MTARPPVGVALCTFNGAAFVTQQLRSILDQSPAPAEIVVGDDGSSDDTVDLVRAADHGSTAVTVLDGAGRLGVTKNFERTVSAVVSPLVALSDQDDVWHRDRLRRLTPLFDDGSVLLVHTDARLVDADGEPVGRTLFEELEVTPAELDLERSGRAFDAFLRRNLATGATVVFRRSLLESALPFPEEWVHDEWLAAVAAALGGVAVVAEPTIDYRLHGANQIGVVTPTLRYKLSRVLEPRGDRNERLARRFHLFADRLDALPVTPDIREKARAKAAFEARRAAFPASRARRLWPVLRLARTGAYGRFASRGRADILRDLVQPA
ncbi:glycosyltransferase family 2 protein [Leifsonia sp. ku-ls]|nr:glycosyltransferase family 2 protein [Leifsonia sp. ku-ls]